MHYGFDSFNVLAGKSIIQFFEGLVEKKRYGFDSFNVLAGKSIIQFFEGLVEKNNLSIGNFSKGNFRLLNINKTKNIQL